jgi:hypothetical protein
MVFSRVEPPFVFDGKLLISYKSVSKIAIYGEIHQNHTWWTQSLGWISVSIFDFSYLKKCI